MKAGEKLVTLNQAAQSIHGLSPKPGFPSFEYGARVGSLAAKATRLLSSMKMQPAAFADFLRAEETCNIRTYLSYAKRSSL